MDPYFGVDCPASPDLACVAPLAARLTPRSVFADNDFLKFLYWSDNWDIVVKKRVEERRLSLTLFSTYKNSRSFARNPKQPCRPHYQVWYPLFGTLWWRNVCFEAPTRNRAIYDFLNGNQSTCTHRLHNSHKPTSCRLRLKTILSLIPSPLKPEVQEFCAKHNIVLIHIQVDKMKEDNVPLSYSKTLMALQVQFFLSSSHRNWRVVS